MNRFVSLLLVALSLAAISLAQPAHAQWTISKVYYDQKNQSSQSANTVLKMTPVGSITLTSTPTGGYYGASAAGSYSGTVDVNYTWTGDPKSPNLGGFNATNTYAVSGSNTSSGSANSQAGSDPHQGAVGGTTVGVPNQTYGSSGGNPATFLFLGNTSTTVTLSYAISATTAASYTGSATASATVTPGTPHL